MLRSANVARGGNSNQMMASALEGVGGRNLHDIPWLFACKFRIGSNAYLTCCRNVYNVNVWLASSPNQLSACIQTASDSWVILQQRHRQCCKNARDTSTFESTIKRLNCVREITSWIKYHEILITVNFSIVSTDTRPEQHRPPYWKWAASKVRHRWWYPWHIHVCNAKCNWTASQVRLEWLFQTNTVIYAMTF